MSQKTEFLCVPEISFRSEKPEDATPVIAHGEPTKCFLQFAEHADTKDQSKTKLFLQYVDDKESLVQEFSRESIESVDRLSCDDMFFVRIKHNADNIPLLFGTEIRETQCLWYELIKSFKETGNTSNVKPKKERKPESQEKLSEIRKKLLSVLYLNKDSTPETVFEGDPSTFVILEAFRNDLCNYANQYSAPAKIIVNFPENFPEKTKVYQISDNSQSVAQFIKTIIDDFPTVSASSSTRDYALETMRHFEWYKGEALAGYGIGTLFTIIELNLIKRSPELMEKAISNALTKKDNIPATPPQVLTVFLPQIAREDGLQKKTLAIVKENQTQPLQKIKELVAKKVIIPDVDQFIFTAKDFSDKYVALNDDFSLNDYGFGWRWEKPSMDLVFASNVAGQLEQKSATIPQDKTAPAFVPSFNMKELAWLSMARDATKEELIAAVHMISSKVRETIKKEEYNRIIDYKYTAEDVRMKAIETDSTFDLSVLTKRASLFSEFKNALEGFKAENQAMIETLKEEVNKEKESNDTKRKDLSIAIEEKNQKENQLSQKTEELERLKEKLKELQALKLKNRQDHAEQLRQISIEAARQRARCECISDEIKVLDEVTFGNASGIEEELNNLSKGYNDKITGQTKLDTLTSSRLSSVKEKHEKLLAQVNEQAEKIELFKQSIKEAVNDLEQASREIKQKKKYAEEVTKHFDFSRTLYKNYLAFLQEENARASNSLEQKNKNILELEKIKLDKKEIQDPVSERVQSLKLALQSLINKRQEKLLASKFIFKPRKFYVEEDEQEQQQIDGTILAEKIKEQQDLLLTSGTKSMDLLENFTDIFIAKTDTFASLYK